jgi:TfoX/Sxy family transcriptional regulator of competence genes
MVMGSSAAMVEYIEDQLSGLDIRTGRMFGEYCLYCDGKVAGFICDDILFIKPSSADPGLLEGTEPAPPYPGAKDYHSVPGDLLENREWLQAAVQATVDALPSPKPKTKPKPRSTPKSRAEPGSS